MTNIELSQEFDTLLHSYNTFNAYGVTIGTSLILNEYEKSVYLTTAQEQLIKEYYSGNTATENSFESIEEVRKYLQALVTDITLTTQHICTPKYSVSKYSQFYKLTTKLNKHELWYIIFETAKIGNRTTIVKPTTHDKVYSLLRNPLKTNFLERTFRLEISNDTIELINKYPITEYFIRYLKKPRPIILEDFENLTINGYSTETSCELHESLHRPILERAYLLALQTFSRTNSRQENDSAENRKSSEQEEN